MTNEPQAPALPLATESTETGPIHQVRAGDLEVTYALEDRTLDDFRQLRGLGAAAFTPDEVARLRATVPDEELDILPTGEVYLHQIGYRQRLLDVFGPGAWGLVALGDPVLRDDTLVQLWALVIRGRVVATAPGEANYKTDRAKARKWEMAYGTAMESAKSNALMRCCKDIGVAAQNWDRKFTEDWKSKYAVHVYRTDKSSNEEFDEWRTLERGPHWNETGVHPGSPNKAAWKTQIDGASASGYVRPPKAKPAQAPRGPSGPPMENEPPTTQAKPRAQASKPTAAAQANPDAAERAGLNAMISDAQYNYMKGMLRTNHVEAQRLFDWLKRVHQVEATDGHGIPKRLFNACKAWVEAGGPADDEVGG